jgi:hypothetical protein
VRRFPASEVAIGQGAIDAQPAELRGRAGPAERPRPCGERESGRMGKEKGSGPNSSNKTFLNFYFDFEFLATLEICTRRFRRNFDMGFFHKFF